MEPSLIVEDSCGRAWTLRPGCDTDPEGSARIAESVVVSLVGSVRHRGPFELARLLRFCAEASCDLAWREHLRDLSEAGQSCSVELGHAIMHSLLRAVATGRVALARVPAPPVFVWEDNPLRGSFVDSPSVDPRAVTPEKRTWFEVRVVDEHGAPIAGLDVALGIGPDRRVVATNGRGVVRWEADARGERGVGSVAIVSSAAVREKLAARTNTKAVALPEGTALTLRDPMASVLVTAEAPHTLVVVPHHSRVRLVGMHFDKNRCFLLPSAMHGIRKVRRLYDAAKTTQYLVVGHTDASGEAKYNETLSLERAQAIVAFLKDDAGAWAKWFSAREDEKRWGKREVSAMLSALPEGAPPFVSAGHSASDRAIQAFQQWSNDTRGTALVVDGKAGDLTQRALIEAYMALDHTSLPPEATISAHGCGPHFPPSPDDADADEPRRVDVFAFDGPPSPAPPGPISKRGAREYPEWVRQMTETLDVRSEALGSLGVWLMDEQRQRMPGARYRLRIGATAREGRANAAGLAEEHGLALSPRATLSWGELPADDPRHGLLDYRYEREVHTLLTLEAPTDDRVLHNLAYTTDSIENRLVLFEVDYEAPRDLLHDVHRAGTSSPEATERG